MQIGAGGPNAVAATTIADAAPAAAGLCRHALGLSAPARAHRDVSRLFVRAAAGAVGFDAAWFGCARPGSISRTIGLFALVGTPYTVKFLWAPLVDALDVPVLSHLLGRRRGWLILSQLLLIAAIVFLALTNPAADPWLVAFGALLVATASATQDIVVDAFRVESLPESEQAAGMASYVAAYRIGMLASTAGALFLVSGFEALGLAKHDAWSAGYIAVAALVVIGMVTTLIATEPEKSAPAVADHARHNALQRVAEAAVGAFRDFLLLRLCRR